MKKKTIVFIISIIIFTTAIVPKTFQNDTFFAIAVGDLVLDNGIDMMEHFTWHENMSYCYSHWLFDIIIALINNFWGYNGIYIFIIILANITAVTLFKILKRNNNEIISFAITLLTIYLGGDMFVARAQIISFVLFIIQVYCIEEFLKTPNKKYIIPLFIIPIIIANMHAAVWPMCFIMYLPYIGEYLLSKIELSKIYKRKQEKALYELKKENISDKDKIKYEQIIKKAEIFREQANKKKAYKIIIEENDNVKKLIIIMLFTILTGFITPIGETPFTYMIKQIENKIVSNFISEMRPIMPISNVSFMVLTIIYISILTFTDSKIKASDAFFILGFTLMTLCSIRSIYYLIWIGAIPLTRIINNFMLKYGENEIKGIEKHFEKTKLKIILILLICICSMNLYTDENLDTEYVDEKEYPVEATNYILNNLDIYNMKLYNEYNYGSYLEMKGIPVFIDSRADIWCEEFNDTTVLEDEKDLSWGKKSYAQIFEKYNITHVLVYKDDIIDIYISQDNKYEKIYSDDNFVLYEFKKF